MARSNELPRVGVEQHLLDLELPNTNKVELLGFYGGDETHALSAWTSTSRELTDEKRARIPALLNQLARDGHHTPFEKSMIHFLVTTETASHIQTLKHRIAVPANGESARYKELKDDKFYIPPDWPVVWQETLRQHMMHSYDLYHRCLKGLEVAGLTRKRAKESARFFLPYANQTVADVSFNFRSFMHFQTLRNEDHAQDEIHWIADWMLQIVEGLGCFEHSLAAFRAAGVI